MGRMSKFGNIRSFLTAGFYLTLLSGCGGGSSSPSNPAPPADPTYSVGGTVTGMNTIRSLELKLGEEVLLVSQNGTFSFLGEYSEGDEYEVEIERKPARQDCEISNEAGVISNNDVVSISVVCEDDETKALFSLDRLHKIRLSMTLEEWRALELDTLRSNYSINDATGGAFAWTSWTHSEIYRQANFEYLDDQGILIEEVEKVGFKMQGNTSRQYPVDYENDPWRPRRFSFAIKFDEKFDEDESVYSCIDANGNPAVTDFSGPCLGILGQNIPDFLEADDRTFMGVEKLRFRFNRHDPSYQREVLTHQLLNEIGVPTARAAHAQVELVITGAPGQVLYGQSLPLTYNMGVFVMVEQIDKTFLKRYFDENDFLFKVGAPGNLAGPEAVDTACDPYEDSLLYYNENFCMIGVEKSDPESAEEWLGSDNYLDPDFVNTEINKNGASGNVSQFVPYRPTYDLKTKKKKIGEGRLAFIDFAQFVQTEPTAAQLSERFDVSGFIRAQAAEIVTGAVDHYVRVANNYYLYFNEPSERWMYIPTDFDYTHISRPGPNCAANASLPDCTGILNPETFTDAIDVRVFPSGSHIHWAGEPFYPNYPPILWNIVFSDPANKVALYTEIQQILDSFFDWSLIGPMLEERKQRLHEAIISTDAAITRPVSTGGSPCEDEYNAEEIDGDESTYCEPFRASIRRFVEERRIVLQQEINENS